MKFVEISFNNIKLEVERYLREIHSKAGIVFSPASPFGHLLDIVEKMHQNSFLYLKNSLKALDLSQPNSNNPRNVRNIAIGAGHIPGRAISSTGTLKLIVKSGIDLDTELQGRQITFKNNQLLRNNTNGLYYSIKLNQEKITYNVNNSSQIFLPIIQGKFEQTKFTGTGEINQTFQITNKGNKKIENFNISVFVNGNKWEIKKSLYDIIPNEDACVVRTGYNNGIDIIFGNGGHGSIPQIGTVIEVLYLISNGSDGNIFRRTVNDWNFVEDAVDGIGVTVDISSIFDILIYNDINFGSNEEDVKFTKNILPIVSNNFVIGLPSQYAYIIKRLGVFSHVNAYEDQGVVYVVATPNIKLFKNRNADYFAIDKNAFLLDNYEKAKIDRYIRSDGNIQLTKKYRIDSPQLSYYIMNVFIIRYSDSTEESVSAQIIELISNYLLDLNRISRIPKSDLIALISSLSDVQSVDIQFISKKNEDYHREEINRISQKEKLLENTQDMVSTSATYNPNYSIGIDPILGDILFEANEYPIIRGGWYDRNGVYFSDDINEKNLKSINIINTGVIDSKNRNM